MCVRIGSAAIATSALLLSASLSRAQPPTMRTTPRDLAGCYVFGLGDWMLLNHRWVPDSVAPAVVTLDTIPSEIGWWRLIPEFTSRRSVMIIGLPVFGLTYTPARRGRG